MSTKFRERFPNLRKRPILVGALNKEKTLDETFVDSSALYLQLVEQPRLSDPVPLLRLGKLLEFSRVKVSVFPPPHEVHHCKPAPAELGYQVIVLE